MSKNRLINPAFRAVAAGMPVSVFTTGTPAETAQGWFAELVTGNGTAGGCTASQGTFGANQTTMPGVEASDYLQLAFDNTWSPGTTTSFRLYQHLPLNMLSGYLSQLSFWIKSSVADAVIGYQVRRYYGTGGSPSPDDILAAGTFIAQTTYQRHSIPVIVTAIADPLKPYEARTPGTNDDGYIEINLYLQNGATVNNLTQAITFDLALAQWEQGSLTTSWEEPDPIQRGQLQNDIVGNGRSITGSSSGGLSAWVAKTSAYTLVTGDRILADSSAGAFNLTLPASGEVWIADAKDTWNTHNVTVLGTVETATNLVLDVSAGAVHLVFVGGSIGWRIVTA